MPDWLVSLWLSGQPPHESNIHALACYAIGNAVPPLMYQKIVAQFL